MPQEMPRIFTVDLATDAALTPVSHNGYTMQSTAMPPVVLTVDGVTADPGLWILVKDQADAAQNGLYQVINQGVAGTTPWVIQRVSPASSLDNNMLVYVVAGTANANTMWRLDTADPITAGSTSLSWLQSSLVSSLALPSSAPSAALTPVTITQAANAGSADVGPTQTAVTNLETAVNTNSTSIASIILALQNAGILA